jgi:hypothetical protein
MGELQQEQVIPDGLKVKNLGSLSTGFGML